MRLQIGHLLMSQRTAWIELTTERNSCLNELNDATICRLHRWCLYSGANQEPESSSLKIRQTTIKLEVKRSEANVSHVTCFPGYFMYSVQYRCWWEESMSGLNTKHPPGEWQAEPKEVVWIDPKTGYRCLIKRSIITEVLCGYVIIDKHHPLFGLHHYSESISNAGVSAYGDLTYSGKLKDAENNAGKIKSSLFEA